MSDSGTKRGAVQVDSLFLAVVFDTVAEAEQTFDILKEGGTVIQQPHNADFAVFMSELKDKFGFITPIR